MLRQQQQLAILDALSKGKIELVAFTMKVLERAVQPALLSTVVAATVAAWLGAEAAAAAHTASVNLRCLHAASGQKQW